MSDKIFVMSKAGRDKGRLFLVLAAFDDESVLIADGLARTVNKPKKKKLKHLKVLGTPNADAISSLHTVLKDVTDSDIVKEVERAKTYFQTGGDNSVKR